MKVAIMQPYLFPYLGYFQLINAIDTFIFYDDVNFIKGGWINRNRIVVDDNVTFFTVPLAKASSFKKISETEIKKSAFQLWKIKFFRTLEQSYKEAPYCNKVLPLVKEVFEKQQNISSLSKYSILAVLEYLRIEKNFVYSSSKYGNDQKTGEQRVIDICLKEDATHYYNAIGGKDLYNEKMFHEEGIELRFLEPNLDAYMNAREKFIPGLSIIDVMMFNSIDDIHAMLKKYQLL